MLACRESPQPGVTTTTVVSQAEATSTSIWPTPTVSTSTTGIPAAPSTRSASGTASARPPRWPRVAIERMNTLGVGGVVLHADPVAQDGAAAERRGGVDGEDGDLVDRLGRPAAVPGQPPRATVISRSQSVDFPAPGAPVSPTV